MRKKDIQFLVPFLIGVGIIVAYYFSTLGGEPEVAVTEEPVAEIVATAEPETEAEPEPETDVTAGNASPMLEIMVSGEANGTIMLELFDDVAPGHVERILQLAKSGAYDNVVFHRVIDGFMAQTGDVEFGMAGGDTNQAGRGGSDMPDLAAEFSDRKFQAGTVGMARSNSPDSANSQFFIMFDAAPHLDGQYTIVGQVTEGLDVLNSIKRGEGGNGAMIGTPDVMTSVKVVE